MATDRAVRLVLLLALALGAVTGLLRVGSSHTALATVNKPPTVTCPAEECLTCLEYSGADNRCLKCGPIMNCGINKTGLPKSPIARYGRALHDVDIYDSPVQPRKVIGMMRKDQEGPVMALHPDGWAQLYLRASPDFRSGGNGWVANDHLRFVIAK